MTFTERPPQERATAPSDGAGADGGVEGGPEAFNATRSNASAHLDPDGRFIHLCAHPGCDSWGLFGLGVSMLSGVFGRWFCAAHIDAALAGRADQGRGGPPGGRPADAQGQGRLL
ncbi:MAG: hypothetical protein QNJ84_11840 [Alphaproteobacteria bacterium]|nr:hypothetical protein [Alphaproteobacteria bacterium]